jgi:hypothetical protein
VCPSNGAACSSGGQCSGGAGVQCVSLRDGVQWLQPTSLEQLYTLLADNGTQARIVAGDTAKGGCSRGWGLFLWDYVHRCGIMFTVTAFGWKVHSKAEKAVHLIAHEG